MNDGPVTIPARLQQIRAALLASDAYALIVPTCDPHVSVLFWSVRVRQMAGRVSSRICGGFGRKCDYGAKRCHQNIPGSLSEERGLWLICGASYQRPEIRLANDAYAMPLRCKLLGLSVLGALLVPGKPRHILITNHENRRLLCYTRRDLASDDCC